MCSLLLRGEHCGSEVEGEGAGEGSLSIPGAGAVLAGGTSLSFHYVIIRIIYWEMLGVGVGMGLGELQGTNGGARACFMSAIWSQ